MQILLSGEHWFIHPDEETQPERNRWIRARVPGNIQADLETAHLLTPLSYGLGDFRLYEVAYQDWWYRLDFDVPDTVSGKRVTLVFEGVDHECEIWLNGHVLGAHQGMFRRFEFDVSRVLNAGASNHLAVKVTHMPDELSTILIASDGEMSGGGPEYPQTWGPDFFVNGINQTRQLLHDLKSPTNFGWDWGYNLYTLGIWKDVRLDFSEIVRIDWVQVQTSLTNDFRQAEITIQTDVNCTQAIAATLECTIQHHKQQQQVRQHIDLNESDNHVDVALTLEDPALWFPTGLGSQPLYDLLITLYDTDGRILQQYRSRFGIREIRWEQVEGAAADFINPFQLVVNGIPVRMMGSNLIPPDLMFGRMNDKGLRLIRLAHEAGMNTLRIWGGGALLSDAMYDLADELGIMLSQEFPLANCVPESDPVFLENLSYTISNIIKRLRNHPAIIEWSGGNEMNWKQGDDYAALKLLEHLTSSLDDRIFRATCPMQGSRHSPWHYDPDTHYQHYDNPNLTDNLKSAPLMRYGEFGCQTPANLEVWKRTIPLKDRHDLDNLHNPVLVRKNVVSSVFDSHFWLLKPTIEALFGRQEDLADLVEAGQFLGAEGLRYAVDALRRRGRRIGGFTTWDFNEPWLNGAGSFQVDHDGRPLMNYDFIKQALAPVALSLKYDSLLYDPQSGLTLDLWSVSDSTMPETDLRWSWLICDSRGKLLDAAEGVLAMEPREVKHIQTQIIRGCSGPVIVALQLCRSNGQVLSERVHLFGDRSQESPLGGFLQQRGLRRTELELSSVESRVEDDQEILILEITNRGEMTALFCEVHPLIEYRTDFYIDYNHLCIAPNQSRQVSIRVPTSSKSDLSLLQTGWRVTCWNAPDCSLRPHRAVLLSVGRRDATTEGYSQEVHQPGWITLAGTMPDPSGVPAIVGNLTRGIRFVFVVQEDQVPHNTVLHIHTADQDAEQSAEVSININGTHFAVTLPKGLGIQIRDRDHLAYPASEQITIPANVLHEGKNVLEISVANESWFTWDALQLISLSE